MKKGFVVLITAWVLVSIFSGAAGAGENQEPKAGSFRAANESRLMCALSLSSISPFDREYSDIYVTKGGYVASTKEALLDKAMLLVLSGDNNAFVKFVRGNPLVFFLKGDLWAQIEKKSLPGKVKIRLMDFDISIWTLKEAIDMK